MHLSTDFSQASPSAKAKDEQTFYDTHGTGMAPVIQRLLTRRFRPSVNDEPATGDCLPDRA